MFHSLEIILLSNKTLNNTNTFGKCSVTLGINLAEKHVTYKLNINLQSSQSAKYH